MADHVEGRVIGRYELLLPIARGGMGTVHLARMRGIGGFERDVALKLAHDHLDPDLATQDLFAEAKIAARLRHPNVVPVLDVGEDDGRPYIVMDYVEGDSLAGLLRASPKLTGEPMPIAIGLRAVADSLAGLHAAHELVAEDGTPLSLVHRDFSPQNVLIGLDGNARLTDFGVAKLLARADSTRSGVVKGKVRYMSPEQARGEPLDRRCDVWAAGVVLWEMLARKRLFTGDNDANVLLKIVTAPAPPLREIDPEIHPALEALVAAAVEHDLAKRTATARALRQALVKAIREAELGIEQEDVAAFVQRIAGDAVAERRAKAAAVARASALKTAPSKPQLTLDHTEVMAGAPVAAPPPRAPPPPPPPSDADASRPHDGDTTSGAASLVSGEPPPRARPPLTLTLPHYDVVITMLQKQPLYVAIAGACVALFFAGATLIVVSLARRHADAQAPAAANTASSDSPAATAGATKQAPLTGAAASAASAGALAGASIVAAAPPSAVVRATSGAGAVVAADAPRTHVVEFRANAEIREIRYLDRSVAVEPPRTIVLLAMPATADLPVEAVASDGRKASAKLAADAPDVALTFAPKPGSVPNGGAVPAPPDDGLAPSPYKRKK